MEATERESVPAPTPIVIASPDPIAPDVLADLMVASALQSAADVVTMRSREDTCVVSILSGGRLLGKLEVPAEVGYAAATRLAIAAGVAAPFPQGGGDDTGMARFEARVGDQVGELILSMSTTRGGLDLELHPLYASGRPPGRRVSLRRCPVCRAYQPPQRARCDEDGAILEDVVDDPSSGGTIATYRIDEVIGQGSMGVVFAAEHAFIHKLVAIKVLHRALAEDAAIVRRFLREARAASQLAHKNVLEVTDYGMLPDGRPYMVMERLSGEALDQRLEREGALPTRAALLIGREIAVALAAAHAAGVLHNDLKPANVVLLEGSMDEAPRLKLVDFGAASLAADGPDGDDLTIGTPHYMAPERVIGRAPDARSDVYGLGVVLYEMLTGQVPFTGGTNGAVMLAQVRQPLPPLSCPEGPPPARVARMVERALAKAPADRQETMSELIADLDASLSLVGRRTWRWLWT